MNHLWFCLCLLAFFGCAQSPRKTPPVCWTNLTPAQEIVEKRLGRYTLRIFTDSMGSDDQSILRLYQDDRLCWTEKGHCLYVAPAFSRESSYDVPTPKERMEKICGRDINGDGWPELVITEWTGGAHACFNYWIWSLRRKPVLLAKFELGSGVMVISDIDYDGVPELLAHDDNFAYWHECFAASPMPSMIYRWERGQYRLATNRYIKPEDPVLARKKEQLKKLMNGYVLEVGNQPGWSRDGNMIKPPTELWDLMLSYIYCGEGHLARKLVDELWNSTISGRQEFIEDFDRELRDGRFWRRIEKMTPRAKRWSVSCP